MIPDAHQEEVPAFRQGQDAEVKARAKLQITAKCPQTYPPMLMWPAHCLLKACHRVIHG
jgi:hypothetical protein